MKICELSLGNDRIFPQANDIYKVISIIVLNREGIVDEIALMTQLNISTTRQIQYYRKAASFLGLFNQENQLTELGKIFADQSIVVQLELMAYFILSINIFNNYYFTRDEVCTIEQISEDYGYNLTTATRRFSTVESWIHWCDVVISDYNIDVELGY